jgi:hypothetical protein
MNLRAGRPVPQLVRVAGFTQNDSTTRLPANGLVRRIRTGIRGGADERLRGREYMANMLESIFLGACGAWRT